MVLPQVLLLFFCLYVGYLFVCIFLPLTSTKLFVELILFPTMCPRNVYHGLWFVPGNVWQIKPEIILTLHYWIVVAPIFIEFKYIQQKLTTHMPTIVVIIWRHICFCGPAFLEVQNVLALLVIIINQRKKVINEARKVWSWNVSLSNEAKIIFKLWSG